MLSAVSSARELLLARPDLIDARAAALRILEERERCSKAEARDFLNKAKSLRTLAAVFELVMPQEYQRAVKRSRLRLGSEFTKALGFPIYDLELQLEEFAETGDDPLSFSIPIVALNYHVCLNCQSFKDLDLVYQLALLIYREDEERLDDRIEKAWANLALAHGIPERLRPTGTVDLEILFKLLAKQRGPLRYLGRAIDMAEYNTGSFFFDFNPEDGEPDVEWTPENVIGLRKEYKLAKKIQREIDSVDKWLKAQPGPRIRRALGLYHKARKLTDAKRRKESRKTNQGRALVGVL